MFLLIIGSGVQSMEWEVLSFLESDFERLFVSHRRVGTLSLSNGCCQEA